MLGIYCRTSKNRTEKYTIDNQRETGIKCANNLGIGFRVYIDDGISGTLDDSVRDGLADLFSDIRKNEITHVYCIDQSRIERDSSTWDFFVALCINNDVDYVPSGTYFDLKNPTNLMYARLMSVVNAYYSEITSKKVRLANAKKAKLGKTHGLKAYGYKKDELNNYIVYKEEAKIIKKIFDLSLNGIGTYTIANILNNEGVPTKFSGNFTGKIKRKDAFTKKYTYYEKSKVKWRGNVIYDMLRNKIYKGIREWNRHEDKIEYVNGKKVKSKIIVEKIISEVPPIISHDLWDKVNANLSLNKKNVGKRAEYHYLLNGLVVCSHCGKEVIGKKRLLGNDNAYKCKGKRPPNNDCKESRGLSLPKLETFLIEHLFNSKELKKLLASAPKNGNESMQLRAVEEKKKKELDRLEKVIERLAKAIKNPDLADDETFTKDYIEAKKKRITLQSEIDDLLLKIAEVENHTRNKRTVSLIKSYSIDAGFDEVKRLIHSLVERIEIFHGKEEKSGHFVIKIIYKHYNDESVFFTNWQAMKWNWHSYYRKAAITNSDIKEDKDFAKDIQNYYNKKNASISKNFKGFETTTIMHKSVELKENELIYFD